MPALHRPRSPFTLRLTRLSLGFAVATLAVGCKPEAGSRAPGQDADASLPSGPAATLGDEGESMGAEAEMTASAAPDGPRPDNVIYRSELMRATKNGRPAYLLSQLAPEPYRPRGSREGWLITRVFPSDPELCAPGCDLHEGDIVLTVNGSPLERPEQLSALIEQLETMQSLEVRLVRDQKLHTRTYEILDGPT